MKQNASAVFNQAFEQMVKTLAPVCDNDGELVNLIGQMAERCANEQKAFGAVWSENIATFVRAHGEEFGKHCADMRKARAALAGVTLPPDAPPPQTAEPKPGEPAKKTIGKPEPVIPDVTAPPAP